MTEILIMKIPILMLKGLEKQNTVLIVSARIISTYIDRKRLINRHSVR